MPTASTINVNSGETTIDFSVLSDPMSPIVTISSNQPWIVTGSNLQVKVQENTDTSNPRSGNITLTASTTANSAYDGIATATSSYTITQEVAQAQHWEFYYTAGRTLWSNNTQNAAAPVTCLVQYTIDGQVFTIGNNSFTLIPGQSTESAEFELATIKVPIKNNSIEITISYVSVGHTVEANSPILGFAKGENRAFLTRTITKSQVDQSMDKAFSEEIITVIVS